MITTISIPTDGLDSNVNISDSNELDGLKLEVDAGSWVDGCWVRSTAAIDLNTANVLRLIGALTLHLESL